VPQTGSPDLVLHVPCDDDGEYSFVLDPPQGRCSFRFVVRCQDSKREVPRKKSSRFSNLAAVNWAALLKLIF
jgi:hypothetical protein